MKLVTKILLTFSALLLGGCVTKDFKVVDSLRAGMTKEEAKAAISSFGFERAQILGRSAAGWVSDDTFANLPSRARASEDQFKKKVVIADYYPVGHGLLGAGQLFLFYGEDGRLLDFYRHQIN